MTVDRKLTAEVIYLTVDGRSGRRARTSDATKAAARLEFRYEAWPAHSNPQDKSATIPIQPMYERGDYIKAEFKDDRSGESEWMWVRVDSDDPENRIVFGTLDNQPLVSTDLRLGMELAVSYDNIREHRTPESFNPV